MIIAVEGPDLIGKTTVVNLLVEKLRKKYSVEKTQLPSELITGVLTKIIRNSKDHIPPEVVALIYAADHLYHYERVIKNNKKIIVQDRSILSFYVYQGLIQGVDLNWLREIDKYNKNIPDVIFVLISDNLDDLLKRKEIRDFDIFEKKEILEKQIKIWKNLPEFLTKEFNIIYIDANRNTYEIVEEIYEIVENLIKPTS